MIRWDSGLLYLFPPIPLIQHTIIWLQIGCNLSRPMVAMTTMVRPLEVDVERLPPSSVSPQPPHMGQWTRLPSWSWISETDAVEDSPAIRDIVDRAWKPSTKILYWHKWRAFLSFVNSKNLPAVPVSLKTLLTFILHLFHLGLAHSTLKVYIAAVVAYQPSHSEAAKLSSDFEKNP